MLPASVLARRLQIGQFHPGQYQCATFNGRGSGVDPCISNCTESYLQSILIMTQLLPLRQSAVLCVWVRGRSAAWGEFKDKGTYLLYLALVVLIFYYGRIVCIEEL